MFARVDSRWTFATDPYPLEHARSIERRDLKLALFAAAAREV